VVIFNLIAQVDISGVWCCGPGSMDLWNFGILPQHYTVSQLRRHRNKSSPPWKPHISQTWIWLIFLITLCQVLKFRIFLS